ncbi:MAG: flagellar basal body protein [Alphaproteobacteria bacterium]|nr:flagellar basal body protein [Alphaproteobacteria bacterium]
MDAISIALSGLNAQSAKLAATASNIANASTSGRVPDDADPASTVYRPLNVSYTALEAGVRAQVVPDEDGYSVVYAPSDLHANEEGLIAVPNIDFAEQSVNLIAAKAAYKANLAVIRVQDDLNEELLDTLA